MRALIVAAPLAAVVVAGCAALSPAIDKGRRIGATGLTQAIRAECTLSIAARQRNYLALTAAYGHAVLPAPFDCDGDGRADFEPVPAPVAPVTPATPGALVIPDA